MERINTFKVLALCLLLSVLLASCYPPGTLGATGYDEAYVVADNAIPVFIGMPSDSYRFDKVKLLDTDEYGRTLYEYCCSYVTTRVSNVRSYVSLLIVCQSYSKDGKKSVTVSWYDNCWVAASRPEFEYFDFDESTILSLKEENDWGKPLDDSKMIHYTYGKKGNLAKEQRTARDNDYDALKRSFLLRLYLG